MTEPLPKGEATRILDEHGIEAFCDDIIDGLSYLKIADKLGVSKSSIVRWLSLDADRSARASEALRMSAQTWDEKAELTAYDNQLDPSIRRELMSHYRWRARIRDQRQYGEKLQVDQTTTVVNLSDEEIDRRMREIQKKLSEGGEETTIA